MLPARRIHFRHPGYAEPANILLTLVANDCHESDLEVHHDTARIACSILAGCLDWKEIFFAATLDGPDDDEYAEIRFE
jgi:hypothetical protein